MRRSPTRRRVYSDRYLAAVAAALIVVWILAGCVTALRAAGWHTLAGVVGLLALPPTAFGVSTVVWLFPRFVEAMAEIRRERAEAEAGSGVPAQDEGTT